MENHSDSHNKLQDYALIAEIIGGFAILISLIFVGLEIRQSSEQTELNTRAISVTAYQDLIAQIIDINNAVMIDAELADIILRGQEGNINPTTEASDAERFGRYIINVTRHADLACFQYQQGIIDKERLSATLGIYFSQIVAPFPERVPPLNSNSFPGLRECVDIVTPMRFPGEQ